MGETTLTRVPTVLSVHGLRKSYSRRRRNNEVLRDINFEVNQGDVVALLGKNGAGKTTLIKCLCGLLEPDAGEVVYSPSTNQVPDVGLLLEGDRNFYLRLSVQQNLEYFGILKGLTKKQLKERIPAVLENFGLAAKRWSQVKELSRGMKQKVGLASCLLSHPALVFLDEPTLGLDVESRLYLRNKIIELAQQGLALLISSHELGFIEDIATRVLFLEDGVIREVTGQLSNASQAFMTITLTAPLPLEAKQNLQKAVPSAKLSPHQLEIEMAETDLPQLVKYLDVSLIDRITRKTLSLESLFIPTTSTKSLEQGETR